MKSITKLTLILIVVFGFTCVSNAQQTISEEKRKLIAELIVLTKADQQIVEITDVFLESFEKTYPAVIQEILSRNPDLPEEVKENLRQELSGNFQSFSQRFRQRLPVEVDYREFIEVSIYPLYDKFFTEKELGDLVAFYKTETGQKIISVMPQLVAESMNLSQQHLVPKIINLVDRMIKEEIEKVEKGPPPPGRKN
ncbi:MAG: DUF2059 domain-containing protein [Pyrinomonadaceae bacterium]